MEYTALKMFAQGAESQRQPGIKLWLIGMSPGVLTIVQGPPLGQMLQRKAMHFNPEIAVGRYLSDEGEREQS